MKKITWAVMIACLALLTPLAVLSAEAGDGASVEEEEKPQDAKPSEEPEHNNESGKDEKEASPEKFPFHCIIEIYDIKSGKMTMEYKEDPATSRIYMDMTMENPEKKQRMLVISDGQYFYMLDASLMEGMKTNADNEAIRKSLPAEPPQFIEWDKLKKEEGLPDSAYKKHGEEKVGETMTTHFSLLDEEYGSTYHFYVDDKNFVRKMATLDKNGERKVSMTFFKIDLSPKFTDDDFSVPPGFKVFEVGELPE
jgi:outer membrane lipoprotein-sorting protein